MVEGRFPRFQRAAEFVSRFNSSPTLVNSLQKAVPYDETAASSPDTWDETPKREKLDRGRSGPGEGRSPQSPLAGRGREGANSHAPTNPPSGRPPAPPRNRQPGGPNPPSGRPTPPTRKIGSPQLQRGHSGRTRRPY